MLVVKIDTIDNLFEEIKIDYIRLQINGSELEAIQNARKTMKKLKKIVVAKNKNLEIHAQTRAIENILKEYFDRVFLVSDHICGEKI